MQIYFEFLLGDFYQKAKTQKKTRQTKFLLVNKRKFSLEFSNKLLDPYLKETDACHTKANNKKNTGIIGKTSTIGSKGA